MKKLPFVMLGAIALTGCSAVVTDKYYLPSYERTHSECLKWSRDECENTQELKIKVPECWRIRINDEMGTNRDLCVPEQKYKDTYVGQEWKPE